MTLIQQILSFSVTVIIILFSFVLAMALPNRDASPYEEEQQQEIESLQKDEGQLEVQEELEAPTRTINLKAVQDQIIKAQDVATESDDASHSN